MVAYKRRIYLIKRSFQLRFLIRIFSSMAVILGLLSAFLYLSNQKSVKDAEAVIKEFLVKYTVTSHQMENKETLSQSKGIGLIEQAKFMVDGIHGALHSLQRNLYSSSVGALFVSFLLVITLFLITTHRIAGPIYRFEQSVKALGDGDLSVRISLRDKDELKELAEYFNQMAGQLNMSMNEVKNIQTSMDAELANGANQEKLKEHLSSLKKELDNFNIAQPS